MKRFTLSIIGGILIGLIMSFVFWDYQGSTYEILNQAGVDRTVSEMDFDFIFKASLLSLVSAILIYLLWSLFDKKKHEKFVKEFNRNKKSNN